MIPQLCRVRPSISVWILLHCTRWDLWEEFKARWEAHSQSEIQSECFKKSSLQVLMCTYNALFLLVNYCPIACWWLFSYIRFALCLVLSRGASGSGSPRCRGTVFKKKNLSWNSNLLRFKLNYILLFKMWIGMKQNSVLQIYLKGLSTMQGIEVDSLPWTFSGRR